MQDILARHRAILTQAIQTQTGVVDFQDTWAEGPALTHKPASAYALE